MENTTAPSDAIAARDDGPEAELLRRLHALEKLIAEAEAGNPQGLTASAVEWARVHEAEIQ
ncbi:MAG: hypothetical protein N2204_03885, partial [Anaerolineae bacterium]|nr:hypothetical protein [Anaerolineae bacterium]